MCFKKSQENKIIASLHKAENISNEINKLYQTDLKGNLKKIFD